MKKFSTYLKYFTFSFVLIVSSFVFTSKASADTYTYTCPGNLGFVNSIVNLSPGISPYVFTAGQNFTVSALVTSTPACFSNSSDYIEPTLTAKNNSDASVVIIGQVPDSSVINPTDVFGLDFYTSNNPYSATPSTRDFTAPATNGSYVMHFNTNLALSPNFGVVRKMTNMCDSESPESQTTITGTPGDQYVLGLSVKSKFTYLNPHIISGYTASNGSYYSIGTNYIDCIQQNPSISTLNDGGINNSQYLMGAYYNSGSNLCMSYNPVYANNSNALTDFGFVNAYIGYFKVFDNNNPYGPAIATANIPNNGYSNVFKGTLNNLSTVWPSWPILTGDLKIAGEWQNISNYTIPADSVKSLDAPDITFTMPASGSALVKTKAAKILGVGVYETTNIYNPSASGSIANYGAKVSINPNITLNSADTMNPLYDMINNPNGVFLRVKSINGVAQPIDPFNTYLSICHANNYNNY
ncbi:MAG: hypothetical protein NTU81_02150 [Candidatus Nomurabacteria bacterium]|nr:hypothetical protein [Candidatus Nomurabacteria bacterium]